MGIAVMSEWIAGPYLAHGDLVMKRVSDWPVARSCGPGASPSAAK